MFLFNPAPELFGRLRDECSEGRPQDPLECLAALPPDDEVRRTHEVRHHVVVLLLAEREGKQSVV